MKKGNKVTLKFVLAVLLIFGALIFLNEKCSAQAKDVEYVFNEEDSTYQVFVTTSYQDGSGNQVWGRPIPDSLFVPYLFDEGQQRKISERVNLKSIEKDSIELANINRLLKEKTGKGFDERLNELSEKKFKGNWLLIDGLKSLPLSFKKGAFEDGKEKIYPVKFQHEDLFTLSNYLKEDLNFYRLTDNQWVFKGEELKIVLKRL